MLETPRCFCLAGEMKRLFNRNQGQTANHEREREEVLLK